jgi:hypothetical protein
MFKTACQAKSPIRRPCFCPKNDDFVAIPGTTLPCDFRLVIYELYLEINAPAAVFRFGFLRICLENPMGGRSKWAWSCCADALRVNFDQKLKLEYRVITINKSGEGSESNTVMAVL